MLLEARSNFHLFQETCQNRSAFWTDTRGNDHAVGFDTAKFAWSQIRNYGDFATDQFFRLVKLGDASADLANFRSDIHGEFEQFVRTGDAFGGLDFAYAHLDFGKVFNADFFRGCGCRGWCGCRSGWS